MKCPQCEFVSSNKKDLCPKCGLDLRAHKKTLGIPVSNPTLSLSELRQKESQSASHPIVSELATVSKTAVTQAPTEPKVEPTRPVSKSFFSKILGRKDAAEPRALKSKESEPATPGLRAAVVSAEGTQAGPSTAPVPAESGATSDSGSGTSGERKSISRADFNKHAQDVLAHAFSHGEELGEESDTAGETVSTPVATDSRPSEWVHGETVSSVDGSSQFSAAALFESLDGTPVENESLQQADAETENGSIDDIDLSSLMKELETIADTEFSETLSASSPAGGYTESATQGVREATRATAALGGGGISLKGVIISASPDFSGHEESIPEVDDRPLASPTVTPEVVTFDEIDDQLLEAQLSSILGEEDLESVAVKSPKPAEKQSAGSPVMIEDDLEISFEFDLDSGEEEIDEDAAPTKTAGRGTPATGPEALASATAAMLQSTITSQLVELNKLEPQNHSTLDELLSAFDELTSSTQKMSIAMEGENASSKGEEILSAMEVSLPTAQAAALTALSTEFSTSAAPAVANPSGSSDSAGATEKDEIISNLLNLLAKSYGVPPEELSHLIKLKQTQNVDNIENLQSELDQELNMLMSEGTTFQGFDPGDSPAPTSSLFEVRTDFTPKVPPMQSENPELDLLNSELDAELKSLESEGTSFVSRNESSPDAVSKSALVVPQARTPVVSAPAQIEEPVQAVQPSIPEPQAETHAPAVISTPISAPLSVPLSAPLLAQIAAAPIASVPVTHQKAVAPTVSVPQELWAQAKSEIETDSRSEDDFEFSFGEMFELSRNDMADLLFDLSREEIINPEKKKDYVEQAPVSHQKKVESPDLNVAFKRYTKEAQALSVSAVQTPSELAVQDKFDFSSAPLGRRIFATALDLGYAAVVAAIFAAVMTYSSSELRADANLRLAVGSEMFLPYLFNYLSMVFGFWFVLALVEGGGKGQTAGQRLAGIGLINSAGVAPSFNQIFVWAACRFLSILTCGLGMCLVLGKSRRTMHDRLAGVSMVLVDEDHPIFTE